MMVENIGVMLWATGIQGKREWDWIRKATRERELAKLLFIGFFTSEVRRTA